MQHYSTHKAFHKTFICIEKIDHFDLVIFLKTPLQSIRKVWSRGNYSPVHSSDANWIVRTHSEKLSLMILIKNHLPETSPVLIIAGSQVGLVVPGFNLFFFLVFSPDTAHIPIRHRTPDIEPRRMTRNHALELMMLAYESTDKP